MAEPLPELEIACQLHEEGARKGESKLRKQLRENNEQTKRDLLAGWQGFIQLAVEPPMRLFLLALLWGIIVASCKLDMWPHESHGRTFVSISRMLTLSNML